MARNNNISVVVFVSVVCSLVVPGSFQGAKKTPHSLDPTISFGFEKCVV